MRSPMVALSMGLMAGGCVPGSPVDREDIRMFDGGQLVPPGCDYVTVTGVGAEAPLLASGDVDVDPTVKQMRLGFIGDPRTSMVVGWRTVDDVTKTGHVRFGVGTALDQTAVGITFGYRAGFGGGGELVQMHEAHLCGLVAGTEYSYQVVSDDGHTSPVRQFRTAPDVSVHPDAEVAIATVGDSRGGYEVWAQIVAELLRRTPDLVVFSGDAVTLGPVQSEWDDFFAAGEPLFSQVPVVSAHGNHEVNAISYYSQFSMPGDEENFSFDYGHAHLTVLNDSPEQMSDLVGTTKDFLRDDLTAHVDRRWKLVSHHRPVYSASIRHGSDLTLRAEWAPLFDQAQVDVVLSGHDHTYERSKPMKDQQVQATISDGTTYVVSGGAGAELYESGADVWTERHASTHAAGVLRIRRDLLEFNAFDENGAAIDDFMIVKP